MSRFKVTAAGVAFLLAICVPAFGQSSATVAPGPGGPGGWGHRRGPGPGMDGMFLNKLGLTADQTAQISQIHANHKANMQALETQLRTARQALHQAEQGTTFDPKLAEQMLIQSAPTEASLMAERFQMNQEIQAVLTPDQKAKQAQLKAQFEQRMQQRMQEFRARRQQPASTSL